VNYRSDNILRLNVDTHEISRQLIKELQAKNFVLMGDYNYPDIDWEDNVGTTMNSREFLECLEEGFLTQHVRELTRGAACLDLVISRDPDLVMDVEVIGNFANSDHSLIKYKILAPHAETVSKKQLLNYSKADFDAIRKEVKETRWNLQGSASEAWDDFKMKLLDIENRLIPKVQGGVRKKKAIWMSHKAVKVVKKKHKVYTRYKRADHPAYVKAEKEAKHEVEKARRTFENKLAKNIKSDVKSFFAYARSKSKAKSRVGPLEDETGTLVNSDEGMCESFNDYFTSVFTREDTTNIPRGEQVWKGRDKEALCDVIIDHTVVEDRLNKLRADKSTGADGLSPRLLKEIKSEIIQPVLYIWRKSISEGDIPQDWKLANVCPIFKKGSRSEAGNYRPVSLTSQLCKLLETVIRDAIVTHLESNHLISDTQHGFRRGRSCLSNVITFLDKATRLIDDGQACDAIYLDFAKAFDKVPTERLLRKIENHGIRGKLLVWIREWLRERKQRVCIQGTCSSWKEVTSGVPQGSVLGPVLFLIYINDLDAGIISRLLKFADDTKLLSRVDKEDERLQLQADLDRLVEWSKVWQMRFNIGKCKVLHLGRGNANSKYYMDRQELEEVEEERDLGVMISGDLKASRQCRIAYNKAMKMLGMMSRTIMFKNKAVLLSLYKTLVRPNLEYCSPAWSPHYTKDKVLLERAQHRFTRMIPGLAKKDYLTRLNILGIWTLEERRNRADLIEVFKIFRGQSAIPASIFERSTDTRTRGHSMKLLKHRCSTDIRKYFFSERVIDSWNRLDQQSVNALSVNAFKSNLNRLRNTQMGLFADSP